MEAQLVGFGNLVLNVGVGITSTTRYNCSVVWTSAGVYTVTLGEGGVDSGVCEVNAIASAAVGAGAGTARTCAVNHTSDTVKVILVKDDAGAAVDPAQVWFSFKRLPPLS